MEFADGMIFIIRNPYDAIVADFYKQMSNCKSCKVSRSKFRGHVWDKFVHHQSQRWKTGLKPFFSSLETMESIRVFLYY